MKRFFGKALRWGAILLATLLVLLLAFYAEEDWRGARDWAACQKELAAKGETLDLRQLVPPGNPADDLSKVPIFTVFYKPDDKSPETSAAYSKANKLTPTLGPSGYDAPKSASYLKREQINLSAWREFYRKMPESKLSSTVGTPAQDVLVALSQFDGELKEIDQAVSKIDAFWPVNYEKPFDTPLAGEVKMINVARILQLRGAAHLANGEAEAAKQDFLFSFRLNKPLARNCFLVSYFVAVGVRSLADSTLWEGLHRHTWTDAQLREMEEALASEDWLSLAPKAYRTDRADSLQTMNVMLNTGRSIFQRVEVDDSSTEALYDTWYLRPLGWWNQDKRHYALQQQNLINSVDFENRTLNKQPFFDSKNEHSIWKDIYIPLTETVMPVNRAAGQKVAWAETHSRLARLACRLEEYRIAHGQYPEKLEDLPDLPSHLNQEVLSIQPLHYARKGEGYLLYSTAWDQKDDGGEIYSSETKLGDWVWPSP